MLAYGNTKRKLYCFAVTECHSRMLYLEFTHSQKQEVLHRCLVNAFSFFGGCPKELVSDNMLTAVLERQGPVIRYNEAFLTFLLPFKVIPRACNKMSPHEKGKVEKGVIHYIRHNFWPLRTFKDIYDVQAQAEQWRDTVANVRLHATTGQRPVDRFRREALNPLPAILPDCRESSPVKVHVDFSVRFDGNTYTVPPWAVGKEALVSADHDTVNVLIKEKTIATYARCWERKRRIESPHHREAALKGLRKHWASQEVAVIVSLGEEARAYLELVAAAGLPLKKDVVRLLALKDRFGSEAVIAAIRRALSYKALGASAIENIIRQQQSPPKSHPPLKLQEERFNRIRLQEPSLAEYDAFILRTRKGGSRDNNS